MKILILIILFFFSRFVGISQTRTDLERQRNNTLKEIAETENVLGDVRKNKNESLETYSLIDKKITLRNSLIKNLTLEIKKVDLSITELESKISLLNSDIEKIKREYSRLIFMAYITSRHKYNYLMFILSAQDINQAYRRLKYIKQYSEYRSRQVKNITNVQNSLGNTLLILEKQKDEKITLLNIQQKENQTLKTELTEKSRLVANLKIREKELAAKLKDKNRVAEKLKLAIEKMIRSEIKMKSSKVTDSRSRLTPDDIALSVNFKDNKGKLPWPTDRGVITGFFGEHEHPLYKGVKIPNNGIDISTIRGSNVRAIFDGEVRYIIPILGANYAVLVRHGNYFTLYSNIIDVNVKAGDKVKTKQIIGKIYTDENTKASILHLELWEELNKQDPQIWLSKN